MAEFEHLILTKFNLRVHATVNESNLKDPWLSHRFEVFDKFCYHSIANQTNQNFKWLVFMDPRTEPKYLRMIKKYSRATPVFVPGIHKRHLDEVIPKIVPKSTKYLITTRLDNDDALHCDHVKIVQAHFNKQKFEFLNLKHGCQYHSKHVHKYMHNRNPFISLVEEYNDDYRTVWCCTHGAIYETGDVRQVDTKDPMWMMVIHEKNAMNWASMKERIDIDIAKDFSIK